MTNSPKPKRARGGGEQDDEWGEHTPITDFRTLYDQVGQIRTMTRIILTSEIPELHEAVDSAMSAAQSAQREAYEAKNAATLTEQRVADVCKRVEVLEPLQVNGAKREVRLSSVEEKIAKASERKWNVWLTLLGIIVTGLGSIGMAIWWASGVEASTTHEMQVRESADKAIIERLSDRPTRDEVLTREELKALRQELVRQREPTVEEWLNGLPPAKQQAIRRAMSSGGHE